MNSFILLQGLLFVLLLSYVLTTRTNEERVELVLLYGSSNRCSRETARRFNALATTVDPIAHTTVQRLIAKFKATFSVKDAPRSGRGKAMTEDQEIDVLADFIENPRQSISEVAERHGVSYGGTQRLLKHHKFHPYKVRLIHELNEDDPDRRLQFCDTMQEKITDDPDFLMKICFSDESTFFLNGEVNRHNCRYWAQENPLVGRETHTQYPQKINVWCGILGDRIIGPFFIDGNLTGPLYLQMLEEAIVPKIIEAIEDSADDFDPWFQQDGAPPHFSLQVRAFLDEQFPDQWIGRRGTIEWPARSPDLTPLDYFLWGHLKSKVYETAPRDIAELRQRIIDECAKITPEILRNVREEFEYRLCHCQAKDGYQFEQEIR